MRFLAEQQPSSEVVARLAELFLPQAIREYVERLPPGASGWLRGLHGPGGGARRCRSSTRAMPRSSTSRRWRARRACRAPVLGERFAELIGEPPMRYCARWRMRMAANMLRDGKQNAANVAYSVGFNCEAAFNRAFKREYGEPPATWRRQARGRSARSARRARADGLPRADRPLLHARRTARGWPFRSVGEGPPLVKTANWLNHLEHDWKSPLWRHWLHEFTRGHSLIRYDERANGLSDWDTPEISFDAFVDDLECVVDCAGLDKFDLLGISQGAVGRDRLCRPPPRAGAQAVICGGYAAGWAARGDPEEIARREAMLTLTEVGWGADNPPTGSSSPTSTFPGGRREQIDWFNEMQRVSCSPENAVKLQRALSLIDVRDLLPQGERPDADLPLARRPGRSVRGGRISRREYPGSDLRAARRREPHPALEKEPAWTAFARLARQFLSDDERTPDARQPSQSSARPQRSKSRRHCTRRRTAAKIAFADQRRGRSRWSRRRTGSTISEARSGRVRSGATGSQMAVARPIGFIRDDMRGFGLSDSEPPASISKQWSSTTSHCA